MQPDFHFDRGVRWYDPSLSKEHLRSIWKGRGDLNERGYVMSRDRGHGFLGRCWFVSCIDVVHVGENCQFGIGLI
jgi:hypothetical protein